MSYPVDPTDPTSPTDLDGATQGAEEFRKLKEYIQDHIPKTNDPTEFIDPVTTNVSYERFVGPANSGANYTIDLSLENIFAINLTANCTIAFSNLPTAGKAMIILIKLIQGGAGNWIVTWPASVVWPSHVAPTLTTTVGRADWIGMITLNAGVEWDAVVVGLNF